MARPTQTTENEKQQQQHRQKHKKDNQYTNDGDMMKSNLPGDADGVDVDASTMNKSYTERLCQFYVKKPKLAFGMFLIYFYSINVVLIIKGFVDQNFRTF